VHSEKVIQNTRDCVNLEQVIFNLEMAGDYYQKAPLNYKVGSLSPLYAVLVEKDVLPRAVEK